MQEKLETRQKVIAEYWADGPSSELPPGHWELFAAFVSTRDSHTLHQDAKMFFALANAIHDAAIATWEGKRYYDYVRPVTAIRHLFRDKKIKGWNGSHIVTLSGQSWRPYQVSTFPTPPFPEFTSGHSAFSMAAAEALKRFTGSDAFGASYTQTVPLRVEPALAAAVGVTLNWSTFSEAAQEAGESRLYGGIHFYEGNVAGLSPRPRGRRTGLRQGAGLLDRPRIAPIRRFAAAGAHAACAGSTGQDKAKASIPTGVPAFAVASISGVNRSCSGPPIAGNRCCNPTTANGGMRASR